MNTCSHPFRLLLVSGVTLGILMSVAYLLGKSLEGFIPPAAVWLLLAIKALRSARDARRENRCS